MNLQWIVIFSTVLFVQELVGEQTSLGSCCRNGSAYGLSNQHCTYLPHISNTSTCRMAQVQCCDAALKDGHCTAGMTRAKRHGVCDLYSSQRDHSEVRTAEMCCECCMLGLLTLSESISCELKLSVTGHCRRVARTCCLERVHASARQNHNKCVAGTHSCKTGERCVNTDGSYRCQRETSCETGYEITDSNICKDVDECLVGTHDCRAEFICQNTPGSFRCHPQQPCEVGFIQDAIGNCIDLNECAQEKNPCQPGHMCINTVGSYMCQSFTVKCGRGYHLDKDRTHCLDVDECSGSHDACLGHGCVNLLGTFRCVCRSGFTFSTISKSCEDTDECRSYPGRLCAHECENTPGSYRCRCHAGFRLASDNRNCEDVNECESNPCGQQCTNVYGSYHCSCRRGFQLSDTDALTCEDIDECALTSGAKVCSYRCLNTPGSYECKCPLTGYTLAPNRRSCLDIDECAAGTHNCSTTQSCINIDGGFRCLQYECPPNYQRTAESRCELLPCGESSKCHLLPLSISFYNLTFPINIPLPAGVFRLGPSGAIPGDEVQFSITDGDVDGFFGIRNMTHGAVVFLQKRVLEPRDFMLSVETRLIRYGTVSIFVARIAVFVVNNQLW